MRGRYFVSSVVVSGVLSSAMYAQTAGVPTGADPLAACGDGKATFSVSRGPVTKSIPPPPDGNASVYVVEIYNLADKGRANRPTIREGLDGSWLGATQGFTYLSAQVAPGRHHLCSWWQARTSAAEQKQLSLYDFVAEPGRTYVFRVQVDLVSISIDLEPVSEDEGRFLVMEAAPSVSKLK